MIRLLFVGDVMGEPGRRALKSQIEPLIDRERVDFVVANAENAAGGHGLTARVLDELLELPVDVWTSGNHVWDRSEVGQLLDTTPNLLRPANYPEGNPGRGWCVGETNAGIEVAVLNLQGTAFMVPINNAFREADRALAEIQREHPTVHVVLVDMHAEATSEKQALGWYLDGKVTAVLGTHTHVPTDDERLLPNGTAFQTDVGMTGAYESVIGMRPEKVLERFLYNTPRQLEVARRGVQVRGALVDADELSGRALAITRVRVDLPT